MIPTTDLILKLSTSIMSLGEKESAHIGYRQEFYGYAEYKPNYNKENSYRDAQRNRKIRNIFKHLKRIEKQNIWVEKRVTLAKFLRFFFPEDQDYWM